MIAKARILVVCSSDDVAAAGGTCDTGHPKNQLGFREVGNTLGLCRNDGKNNGNYYVIVGYILEVSKEFGNTLYIGLSLMTEA